MQSELEWLREISRRITEARSRAEVLDVVYHGVRDGLGYDRVGINLFDHDAGIFEDCIGTDANGQTLRPMDRTVDLAPDSPIWQFPGIAALLRGADFYYTADAAAECPPDLHYLFDGVPRHNLMVPLRSADRVTGMISVDNLLSGRPIAPRDAGPLLALANQVGTAVENARLHERERAEQAQLAAAAERLRAVYQAMACGVIVLDAAGNITDANEAAQQVLGLSLDGIRTRGILQLRQQVTDPAGVPIPAPPGVIGVVREPQRVRDRLLRFTRDDGAQRWLHLDIAPVFDGDGTLQQVVLSFIDVTARKQAEDTLRRSEARLEVLLESARALNSSLDRDHILQALATRLVAALGARGAAFTHVDSAARLVTSLAHYSAPGQPPIFTGGSESLDSFPVLEHVLRTRTLFHGCADDPGFPESERAYLQRWGMKEELLAPLVVHGVGAGVLDIYWDQTPSIGPETIALCEAIAEQAAVALEHANLYADAAARAERDALTGLLNHRALLHQIDQAVAAGAPFALLLLDVNNFKLFNDTYGHPVGDAVLTQVAGTLKDVCRQGDVAGRYGGDELALLLRSVRASEATTVAQRLSAAVRDRPYRAADGTIIPLSVSVGLALYPQDGRSRTELVAVADQAMYAAKRGGAALTQPQQAADLLGDSPFGVLQGLVNAVDAKDRYTREHSDDVTHLALSLARALQLDDEERRVLAIAGPLHDVGKIAVPDRILRKPGHLTPEEYTVIKQHVAYGVAIIRGVLDDPDVVEAVAHHHERWDGQGYPDGIAGPATPLAGRIMQVADAVSAMRLDRPYRQGLSWEAVAAQLRAGKGTQFDPRLVDTFIAAMNLDRSAS